MVDDIYGIMTRRAPKPQAAAVPAAADGFTTPLSAVSTNLMAGLLETLSNAPYDGRADLPALAATLQFEVDELLPLGEMLQLLGLAVLEEGDLLITDIGRSFVEAETEDRKEIFGNQLRAHVPLINAIRAVIDQRSNHRASAVRFRDELEDHMSPEYAEETLRTVISWGRYAEIFEYDEEAQQFGLEEEDEDGDDEA
jgi:NitT/TauT family transport system ATP-binding protein